MYIPSAVHFLSGLSQQREQVWLPGRLGAQTAGDADDIQVTRQSDVLARRCMLLESHAADAATAASDDDDDAKRLAHLCKYTHLYNCTD